ncbi:MULTISPECIES: hypothetical protein [Mesorhizobium]|uniref:hypothetical protein n=1 Tax=Mesorhizobium TaxID=68287 RepID=UPI000A4D14CB|nr:MULTISPECIES: hypothetical protein [Mesorhizobium]MDF3233885.1 hypothetical protein [Mesorhizobium sp. DSM 30133]
MLIQQCCNGTSEGHRTTVVKACDRVGVLYAGDLVADAPAGKVFVSPRHPLY